MFWEKFRQRTNHQQGKTEENTTLMIGIGPATNTDLVLYCTVLYCTVLQVSLAPLDPLVTVVQPQTVSCCALLNTAAGCEVGAVV